MGKSSTTAVYMGLGVHMDSIDIAAADAGRDGDVRYIGSIGGDLLSLDKALRKLISRGRPLHLVYEAGPCGFVIWHHLSAQVLAREFVALSSIPKRSGDRVKTDRRDAIVLARLARAGELTAVRVPDAADEAVRELGSGARGRGARARSAISAPRAKAAPRRKPVLSPPTLAYQHEQPSQILERVLTKRSVASPSGNGYQSQLRRRGNAVRT
jgi:transposase